MRFDKKEYPTKWRKKFALFPTKVGIESKTKEEVVVWFEVYKERKMGPSTWQRTPSVTMPGVELIELAMLPEQ